MSSVTSPSMRASSHEASSIQIKPCTLGKMAVKRVVGLNAGLGSISYLESVRLPRGSVAIRVNRNALCVASIRSSRSFFRSEEHTSELQSHLNLVCRLLLEKKKSHNQNTRPFLNLKRMPLHLSNLPIVPPHKHTCLKRVPIPTPTRHRLQHTRNLPHKHPDT